VYLTNFEVWKIFIKRKWDEFYDFIEPFRNFEPVGQSIVALLGTMMFTMLLMFISGFIMVINKSVGIIGIKISLSILLIGFALVTCLELYIIFKAIKNILSDNWKESIKEYNDKKSKA
jgi:uncharacterized membrane-anchored protein